MADDVERQTVIRPALDPSGVVAGAQGMAQAVIGALNQIQAANATTARSLAGNSAAFEAQKRALIDGYSETQKYAKSIQDITLYGRAHQEQLGLITQMLTTLSAKYGLVGDMAAQAAQKALLMRNAALDASGRPIETSAGQRIQAQTDLIEIINQGQRNLKNPPPPPAPPLPPDPLAYREATATRRQRQALGALSEGRAPGDDIFGLGVLGYDRNFGTSIRGANSVIRNLQARGLVDAQGNLTGATAYGLAGVQPPPDAPGFAITGQQLHQGLVTSRGPLGYADYLDVNRQYYRPPETAVQQNINQAVTGGRGFGPPGGGGPGGPGGPDDGRGRFPGLAQVVDADIQAGERLIRQWGLINAAAESYGKTVADVNRLEAGGFLTEQQGAEIRERAWDKARASIGLATDAVKLYQRQLEDLRQLQEAGVISQREQDHLSQVAAIRTGQIPGRQIAQQQQIQDVVNNFAGITLPGAPQQSGLRQRELEDAFGPLLEQQAKDQAAQAEQARVSAISQQQRGQSLANQFAGVQQPIVNRDQRQRELEEAFANDAGPGGLYRSAETTERNLQLEEKEVATIEALRSKYDAVYRVSQQYAQQLREIEQLVAAGGRGLPGGITPEQGDQQVAALNARYTKEQEEATKAATSDTQKEVEANERLRASLDSVYAIEQRRLRTLADIARLQAAGPARGGIDAEQAAALTTKANDEATASQKRLTDSAEHFRTVNAYSIREFIVLGHELAVGLYERIPGSIIVLTEHMGGLTKIVANIGAFFLTLPGIIAASAAAIGVILGVIAYRSEEIRKQVLDLQNQERSERTDNIVGGAEQARRVASEVAKQTGNAISRDEAFQSAGAIRTSPDFTGSDEDLRNLVVLAGNLSKVLRTDLAGATKILTEGFDNAAAAAQKVYDQANHHFPGLDETIIKQLEQTQALHGSAAAWAELRKIIEDATKNAIDNTTDLTKAWRDLMRAMTGDQSLVRGVGTAITNMLVGVLNAITSVLEAMNRVKAFLDEHPFLEAIAKGVSPLLPGGLIGGLGLGGGPQTAANGNNLVGLREVGQQAFQKFAQPSDSIAQGVRQIWTDQEVHNQRTLSELIGGVRNPSTGQLEHGWAPASDHNNVPQYLQTLQQLTGLNPDQPFDARDRDTITKVIKAIAQIESGKPVSDDVINAGVNEAFNHPSGGGIINSPTGQNDAVQRQREGTLEFKIQQNAAEQARNQNQLEIDRAAAVNRVNLDLESGVDPAADEKLKQLNSTVKQTEQTLEGLRAEQRRLISTQQELTRQQQESLPPTVLQAGAARDLAEIYNQMSIAAKNAGQALDLAAVAERQKAKLEELRNQFENNIKTLDEQTNKENALAAATEQGGQALDHIANYEKALLEVRTSALPGSDEYKRQVAELTNAYDRQTEAVRNLGAAELIHQQHQQEALLGAQAQAIGEDAATAAREQAILRARQEQGLAPGDQASPGQQRAIDNAAALTDLESDIKNVEQAYKELENIGTGVFDTLTKALTEPLRQGETAAQRLKQTMNSVVQDILKEFLKLAVINPLLNSLFGGQHRPEIGDVLSAPEDRQKIIDQTKADEARRGHVGVNPDLANQHVPPAGSLAAGLPIDPAKNAMRVSVVDGLAHGAPGGPVAGGAAGGAAHAVEQAAASGAPGGAGELPVPPIPPTTNDTDAAAGQDKTAAAVQQALIPTTPTGLPIDSGANALRVLNVGGSAGGATGGAAGTAASGPSGAAGSGDQQPSGISTFFTDTKQILSGNFDSVFGKGFYENGGLLGQLFGSGGASTKATDQALNDLGPGVYGPETAQQYQDAGGDSAGGNGIFTSIISGIKDLFSGISSVAKSIGFATGGVFDNGHLAPISAFSNSVVHSPTMFRFGAGQTGLMGEAGSEAIIPLRSGGIPTTLGHVLPLARGSGGNLAVDHSSLSKFAYGGVVANDNIVPFALGGSIDSQLMSGIPKIFSAIFDSFGKDSSGGGGGLFGGLSNFWKGGGLLGQLFGGGGGGGGTSLADEVVAPTDTTLGSGFLDDTSTFDVGDAASAVSDVGDIAAARLGGIFASVLHGGGVAGIDGMAREVNAALFANAPRYHDGLDNDEFAAILQRGERVLTSNQNDRLESMMAAVASGGSSGANSDGGGKASASADGGSNVTNHYWNIQTPDADSFRRSQAQITARASSTLNRTQQRNAAR